MDKNELLPFPFCGGAEIALNYKYSCGRPNFHGEAKCMTCGAIVYALTAECTEDTSRQAAAAAWNRRTGPTFVTPDAALKVAVASDPVVSNPPMGGGRA